MILVPLLVALSLLILGGGCTPTPKKSVPAERSTQDATAEIPEEEKNPVRPGAVQAELNDIRRKLDEIARDLTCEQDQECIALAADDNACGIPLTWLIFSTRAPRYIEVEDLLERSFYLDNAYPDSRIQICGGPSQPILKCIDKQCQTVPFLP